MRSEAPLPHACDSGLWLLERDAQCATFRRPSDGTLIELEEVEPELLAATWSALAQPVPEAELERLLSPLGGDAGEFRQLIEAEQLLRWCPSSPAPAVTGAGALQQLVEREVRRCRWAVGNLSCLPLEVLLSAQARPSTELRLSAVGDCVVAIGSGCSGCLALRTLGAIGEPGVEQTSALDVTLPARELAALVAALLAELERAPLAPNVGLLLRHGRGLGRGSVLPHPDCIACAEWRRGRLDCATLQAELEAADEVPTTGPHIESILGSSPFSPLEMTERSPAAGAFPLGGPFISGDTRLTRRVADRLLCTSIPAIAHGLASTAEQSRLLAWSEGAERLGAQSALPDAPQVCRGLDLLRNRECLVPFERVAVGLPDESGRIAEPTFSGTASHVTSLQAILHATVELLKREAFLIAWYRQRKLKPISWPLELPAAVAAKASYLQRHDLELALFDLTADVPLPMLLLRVTATRRVGNWPKGGAFMIPAGGFSPEEALDHALRLACSRFAGIGLDTSPERNPLDPLAVTRLSRAIPAWPGLVRYLDPRRATLLTRMAGNEMAGNGMAGNELTGDETASFAALGPAVTATPKERFHALQRWLSDARLSWWCVPLTDAATARCGLRVMKVVLPEALRFVLEPGGIPRDHPRLLKSWPGAEHGSWNDAPHPLY